MLKFAESTFGMRLYRRGARSVFVRRSYVTPIVLALLLGGGCGGGTGTPVPSAATHAHAQPLVRSGSASSSASRIVYGGLPSECGNGPCIGPAVGGVRNKFMSSCALKVPEGYAPCDLWHAYNINPTPKALGGCPSTTQPCGTVAVVYWTREPHLVDDLKMYRSANMFPACATPGEAGSGCVEEVNQFGKSSPLPKPNDPTGIAEAEWAADVEMVSANCPLCNIVAVEATFVPTNLSQLLVNLTIAEETAAKLPGVVAISNSWGFVFPPNSTLPPAFVAAFNKKGIAITASSGDGGYGTEYFPAAFSTVTAVTGTTLTCNTVPSCGSRNAFSETVWQYDRETAKGASSSVCASSVPIPEPMWQTQIEASPLGPLPSSPLSGCSNRAVGDIAYDADYNTPVAVYCSFIVNGGPCGEKSSSPWITFYGTSVGAPAIAGLYALAGNTGIGKGIAYPVQMAYNNILQYGYGTAQSAFFDITSGNDSAPGAPSCSGSQLWLCQAQLGFDAASGVGSPNGIGGF